MIQLLWPWMFWFDVLPPRSAEIIDFAEYRRNKKRK
jgi:hypothetical protein